MTQDELATKIAAATAALTAAQEAFAAAQEAAIAAQEAVGSAIEKLNAAIGAAGPSSDQELILPALSIVAATPRMVEGAPGQIANLRFNVTATGEVIEACSAAWTTGAHAEDFVEGQALSGRVVLQPGESSTTINFMLAGDTNIERDETMAVTLSDPQGCTIAVSRAQVIIVNDDETNIPQNLPPSDWLKRSKEKLVRSGRPIAGGPTYWHSDYQAYEREVAFMDGFGGACYGTAHANIATWDKVIGGPLDQPGMIANSTQLSWMTAPGSYCEPFRGHIPNTCWICWVGSSVPAQNQGEQTRQEIVRGDHDRRYQVMAGRVMRLLDARGIDPDRFIFRLDHEMQQSNPWRVRAAWKKLYQEGMDHIIEVMRKEAKVNLHYAFAPSKDRVYGIEGDDFGDLLSWMPELCDIISMSFHPSQRVTDRASYEDWCKGGEKLYGLYTDVVEVSKKRNIPIALLEWSPVHGKCTLHAEIYQWLMDDFLIPNKDRIMLELVHNIDTLQGTGGEAFRRIFGGKRPSA